MNPNFDPSQIPLRDIHLPDPVAFWPLAFGWWILAGLAMVALVVLGLRYYAARRHRAARRALQKAMTTLRSGEEPVLCAQRVSTTMRRFAMTVTEEPESVAGLAGQPWLDFLDSRWEEAHFTQGAGRALVTAPYLAGGRLQQEHCLELGLVCIDWVKAQPVRY